jgi:hypothetical protein
MLREDLRDKDIPHRTKIREAIIVAWKEYFASLKLELAVCATFLVLILITIDYRLRLEK